MLEPCHLADPEHAAVAAIRQDHGQDQSNQHGGVEHLEESEKELLEDLPPRRAVFAQKTFARIP